MSRYERAFGTDWEEIDEDEAVNRAYALGVAASLGEYHREELDAIRAEMSSAYNRSVVDLAYEEGRGEAKEIDVPTEKEDAVWNELVSGETVTVDPEDTPTGGRTGLPEAIDVTEVIKRKEPDSTESLELPDFLTNE